MVWHACDVHASLWKCTRPPYELGDGGGQPSAGTQIIMLLQERCHRAKVADIGILELFEPEDIIDECCASMPGRFEAFGNQAHFALDRPIGC